MNSEKLENIIDELAQIFTIALQMLSEEIEENREDYNTFEDIETLKQDWNTKVEEILINN